MAAYLGLAVAWANRGWAQSPGLDLTSIEPPLHQQGTLGSEPTEGIGTDAANLGLYSSFAWRALRLENAEGDRINTPLQRQWVFHYVAASGLGKFLSFGIDQPFAVFQRGDDLGELVIGGATVPRRAVGDLRLRLKATLVNTSSSGGFGLAALALVKTPTGDPESYLSDRDTTLGGKLISELRIPGVALRAALGGSFRTDKQVFLGELFGHALPWSAAFVLAPQLLGIDQAGDWRWTVETRGAVAVDPEFGAAVASPAVLGAHAHYLTSQVTVYAGAEGALTSAAGLPLLRGLVGVTWTPRLSDRDNDGWNDDDDLCPDEHEDFDGFLDDDGCPDPDDDDDAVKDSCDRCPYAAEDLDGFQDGDGCPEDDNDSDSVNDAIDACPDLAGSNLPGMHKPGCPLTDTDADGIFDDFDACPAVTEDADNFQDADGCPEPDNDLDGILDAADGCPNEAGPSVTQGCPAAAGGGAAPGVR